MLHWSACCAAALTLLLCCDLHLAVRGDLYHYGFTPDTTLRSSLADELQTRLPDFRDVVVPDSFDARIKWPRCIHPIRNQGSCGSCWAFGTTESISDRFCIASGGSVDVILSPENLVDCNLMGLENCKRGGDPATAMVYASRHGLASEGCYPYTAGRNGTEGSCRKVCSDGSPIEVYKTKLLSLRWHLTVKGMQQAILKGGPIVSCFSIYSDFGHDYDGRVYTHGENATKEGGHCVKIVGWGSSDEGSDYWIIANSWGEKWGLDGFFLMGRGSNEGGIEREAFSIDPQLQ